MGSQAANDPSFEPIPPVKLVISGNSRILSGFEPEVLRARSRGEVSDLGLPYVAHFIGELETLVARAEVPTRAFPTVSRGLRVRTLRSCAPGNAGRSVGGSTSWASTPSSSSVCSDAWNSSTSSS